MTPQLIHNIGGSESEFNYPQEIQGNYPFLTYLGLSKRCIFLTFGKRVKIMITSIPARAAISIFLYL